LPSPSPVSLLCALFNIRNRLEVRILFDNAFAQLKIEIGRSPLRR
jgi:hypothetical protein